MRVSIEPHHREVARVLVFSSLVSIGFFAARMLASGSIRYGFMAWNLFLAWLPLIFAWQLTQVLPFGGWKRWPAIVLTILWLGFLPNSFYLITDLIHLRLTREVNLLYDVVLMSSFVFNGLVLGFTSLYMVHMELVRRLKSQQAHMIAATILLVCSFAIYLGRYLRWNTWDVIINPAGLLFDVSDRLINPIAHTQTFKTTSSFFILLGSMYAVIWHLVHILRTTPPNYSLKVKKRG